MRIPASEVALDCTVDAECTLEACISDDHAIPASVEAVPGDIDHVQIPPLLKDVNIGLIVILGYIHLYIRPTTLPYY